MPDITDPQSYPIEDLLTPYTQDELRMLMLGSPRTYGVFSLDFSKPKRIGVGDIYKVGYLRKRYPKSKRIRTELRIGSLYMSFKNKEKIKIERKAPRDPYEKGESTVIKELYAQEDYKVFCEEGDRAFIKAMCLHTVNLPLYINDPDVLVREIVKWRLKIGK